MFYLYIVKQVTQADRISISDLMISTQIEDGISAAPTVSFSSKENELLHRDWRVIDTVAVEDYEIIIYILYLFIQSL